VKLYVTDTSGKYFRMQPYKMAKLASHSSSTGTNMKALTLHRQFVQVSVEQREDAFRQSWRFRRHSESELESVTRNFPDKCVSKYCELFAG
jgi:hypothetical protein